MNVGSQTIHESRTFAPQPSREITPVISPEIIKPITVKQKVEPVMTPEIIDNMNKKTVELFNNSDFKSLLNVYLTNPSMFSVFSKFVQHGDIVPIQQETKEYNKEEYEELVNKLEQLNTGLSRDELLERLVKYSGHLNLTLRSILMSQLK